MQTIARANRVYDDEKENGLIVDYGNVYQQLEKAYSIYGEGQKGRGDDEKKDTKPFELLKAMADEIQQAIDEVVAMLKEENFDLFELIDASPMGKIAAVNNGANAVCRNEESRAKFEIAARNLFRKYKALFPEKEAKKFTKKYNAIDAIYNKLNQRTKSADITDIILRLQGVVNDSILIDTVSEPINVLIDLSNLDADALRKAFEKVQRKNELVYDLNKAVEQKLEQMLKENPLRMEFYERYKEIVEEYNNGKTEAELTRSFDSLTAFIQTLSQEEKRAFQEKLDEPTLSIFDLLVQDKELNKVEREEVKKVAKDTLEILQREKLNIPNWKESRELKAGIKMTIYDYMLRLPENKYSDEEVSLKSVAVYQHIYSYASFQI
jgi:type I restriction enzyme R subunit